jgi:hypothetical protein
MHADHQLGILKILEERAKLTTDPIPLIAPRFIELLLKFYSLIVTPLYYTLHFCDTEQMPPLPGIRNLTCVAVEHVFDAYGIVVEHTSGWKLVFGGDCMPS